MSTIIQLPDFKFSKQSSAGREERMKFIIHEVKKNPDFNFQASPYSKERCKNLRSITDTIQYCLRMMHYAPQTRKDIQEQILMELKII